MRETETGQIAFRGGVDEHGAKPPPRFPQRFAVLTWIDRGGDETPPWSLFRECIPVVAKRVGADCVLAEFWKRERRFFRETKPTKMSECAWEELMKLNANELHENAHFPDKLRFEYQGQVVLLAETEWWSSVGGPMPYHDSVTISFFSAENLSRDFEKLFTEAANVLKIEVAQV